METARECEGLGASIIHVHIRDGDHRPTLDPGRLRDTVAALREQTNLVVQLSTGGSVHDPEADRLRVLDAAPDMASCTMGTVNFGADVFVNRWEFIVELHTRMQERGIVAEYEIFDLGQLATLRRLLDRYGPPAGGHVHVDLVMGVPGGMPGTAEALVACLRELPDGATFSATGIGRARRPGDAGQPVRRRAPAGRHGGHHHVRQGPAGGVEHAAGGPGGGVRPAGPAPAGHPGGRPQAARPALTGAG